MNIPKGFHTEVYEYLKTNFDADMDLSPGFRTVESFRSNGDGHIFNCIQEFAEQYPNVYGEIYVGEDWEVKKCSGVIEFSNGIAKWKEYFDIATFDRCFK
jgi:hypothetical protein